MLIKRPEIPASEITDERLYVDRRAFLIAAAAPLMGLSPGSAFGQAGAGGDASERAQAPHRTV